MNFALPTVALVATLTAPLLAQDQAPIDAESVKKAQSVLADSAKAYAAAKALTDTITFTAKTPDGDEVQTMRIALQGKDQARIGVDEMTFTAVGGSLYVERKGIDDKYAQFAINDDLGAGLENEIGFAPPRIVARTNADAAALVEAWTFGMLPMTQIAGHSTGKSASGAEIHKILLSSAAGRGEISIDAATMFVDDVRLTMVMEGMPEIVITLDYDAKPSDALSPAIAFEAGERKRVSSIDDLKIDLTGKPAPDFALESLEGTTVTLAELKGNVVVLDFWATWCGPCKMALPKLSEFAKWAKDNNKPVKVFGVDVWERGSRDEVRKAVREYWTTSNFAMTTLFDDDNAVAGKFGFDSIPTTIIIGPDGKVFAVHTGFNPDMVDMLKKDVEQALAAGK